MNINRTMGKSCFQLFEGSKTQKENVAEDNGRNDNQARSKMLPETVAELWKSDKKTLTDIFSLLVDEQRVASCNGLYFWQRSKEDY